MGLFRSWYSLDPVTRRYADPTTRAYLDSLRIGSHFVWLTPPIRFLFLRPTWWLTDFWSDMRARVSTRTLFPEVWE